MPPFDVRPFIQERFSKNWTVCRRHKIANALVLLAAKQPHLTQ